MWGAIIGGAMGLMGANKQAKAQDRATAAQMAGFNQYKPYVDANLSGASGALDGVLATGAYTGPTYAGPNAFQTGTANNMGNIGGNLQNFGYGMMGNTSGFGSSTKAWQTLHRMTAYLQPWTTLVPTQTHWLTLRCVMTAATSKRTH